MRQPRPWFQYPDNKITAPPALLVLRGRAADTHGPMLLNQRVYGSGGRSGSRRRPRRLRPQLLRPSHRTRRRPGSDSCSGCSSGGQLVGLALVLLTVRVKNKVDYFWIAGHTLAVRSNHRKTWSSSNICGPRRIVDVTRSPFRVDGQLQRRRCSHL